MIQDNLEQVRQKIEHACEKVGRSSKEVTLIAVSKTKPVSDIEQVYEAGCRDFGENKVQEIMDKDGTDNQDNTYGSRQDSGSFTKGSRTDSTTTGEQTTTVTTKVAPYDSEDFANNGQDTSVAGQRQDSLTEGQQLDSSSSTKGQQIDDLNRTYTEDYTLHRVGNIGVQTVTDMLQKHVKMWSVWEFYEYIFKEICKDLLLI